MRRHDGPVSDETVDAYRAIIADKSDIATKPITPGAGVSPLKVCKPSKRLRNWHRSHDVGGGLRKYARVLATTSGDNKATAQRWLASKGIKP